MSLPGIIVWLPTEYLKLICTIKKNVESVETDAKSKKKTIMIKLLGQFQFLIYR